jgi:hypothetical protein
MRHAPGMSVFLQIDNAPVVIEITDGEPRPVSQLLMEFAREDVITTAGSETSAGGFMVRWALVGAVLISLEYNPPAATARTVATTDLASFRGRG